MLLTSESSWTCSTKSAPCALHQLWLINRNNDHLVKSWWENTLSPSTDENNKGKWINIYCSTRYFWWCTHLLSWQTRWTLQRKQRGEYQGKGCNRWLSPAPNTNYSFFHWTHHQSLLPRDSWCSWKTSISLWRGDRNTFIWDNDWWRQQRRVWSSRDYSSVFPLESFGKCSKFKFDLCLIHFKNFKTVFFVPYGNGSLQVWQSTIVSFHWNISFKKNNNKLRFVSLLPLLQTFVPLHPGTPLGPGGPSWPGRPWEKQVSGKWRQLLDYVFTNRTWRKLQLFQKDCYWKSWCSGKSWQSRRTLRGRQ